MSNSILKRSFIMVLLLVLITFVVVNGSNYETYAKPGEGGFSYFSSNDKIQQSGTNQFNLNAAPGTTTGYIESEFYIANGLNYSNEFSLHIQDDDYNASSDNMVTYFSLSTENGNYISRNVPSNGVFETPNAFYATINFSDSTYYGKPGLYIGLTNPLGQLPKAPLFVDIFGSATQDEVKNAISSPSGLTLSFRDTYKHAPSSTETSTFSLDIATCYNATYCDLAPVGSEVANTNGTVLGNGSVTINYNDYFINEYSFGKDHMFAFKSTFFEPTNTAKLEVGNLVASEISPIYANSRFFDQNGFEIELGDKLIYEARVIETHDNGQFEFSIDMSYFEHLRDIFTIIADPDIIGDSVFPYLNMKFSGEGLFQTEFLIKSPQEFLQDPDLVLTPTELITVTNFFKKPYLDEWNYSSNLEIVNRDDYFTSITDVVDITGLEITDPIEVANLINLQVVDGYLAPKRISQADIFASPRMTITPTEITESTDITYTWKSIDGDTISKTITVIANDLVDDATLISADNNVYLPNAPKTEPQLKSAMGLLAKDHDERDLINEVTITNLDGYDYNNPVNGVYNITFEVTGESGNTVTSTSALTIFDETIFSYNTEFVVSDTDDNLADVSELLTYNLTFEYLGEVAVQDVVIDFGFNSQDLKDDLTLSQVLLNNAQTDAYTFDQANSSITINTANPNDIYEFTFTISAADNFIGFDDIYAFYMVDTGYEILDQSGNVVIAKDITNSSSVSLNHIITDKSLDNLASPFETLTMSSTISNDGSIMIKDLVVDLGLTDANINPLISNLSVTTNGRNVDYQVLDDNTISISTIGLGSSVLVKYDVAVNGEISNPLFTRFLNDELYLENTITVSNDNITQTQASANILLDVANSYNYEFSTSLTEFETDNNLANINETILATTTFKNTGAIDINELYFNNLFNNNTLELNDSDFNLETIELVDVTIDNVSVTDYTIIDSSIIKIDNVSPGSELIITYKINLNSIFDMSENIVNEVLFTNTFEDNVSQVATMTKEFPEADYEITMSAKDENNDNLVLPNERIDYTITIENTSSVMVDNLVVDILQNDQNINYDLNTGLVFDQTTSAIFTPTPTGFIVDNLNAGEVVNITYSSFVRDYLIGYQSGVDLYVTADVNGTLNTNLKAANNSLLVDATNLNSKISATATLSENIINDSLATYSETLNYKITFDNDGDVAVNNLAVTLDIDQRLLTSTINEVKLQDQNGTILPTSSYQFNAETGELIVFNIEANQSTSLSFTIRMRNYISNIDDVLINATYSFENHETPEYSSAFIGVDLTGIDLNIEQNFIGNNDGLALVSPGDIANFNLKVINNGRITLNKDANNPIIVEIPNTSYLSGLDIYSVRVLTSIGKEVAVLQEGIDYQVDGNLIYIYTDLKIGHKISIDFGRQTSANIDVNTFINQANLKYYLNNEFYIVDKTSQAQVNVDTFGAELDVTYKVTSSNANTFANASDTLTYEVDLTNTSTVVASDIVINSDAVCNPNLDNSSYKLVSLSTDSSNYEVIGDFTDCQVASSITINELKPGETIAYVYEINVLDMLTYEENIDQSLNFNYAGKTAMVGVSIDLINVFDGELTLKAYDLNGQEITSDQKVVPNQEIYYVLNYVSNSDTIIDNAKFRIDYDVDNLSEIYAISSTNTSVSIIDGNFYIDQIKPNELLEITYYTTINPQVTNNYIFNETSLKSDYYSTTLVNNKIFIDMAIDPADILVEESANQSEIYPGMGPVEFTTRVTNNSNVPLYNMIIKEHVVDENLDSSSIKINEILIDGSPYGKMTGEVDGEYVVVNTNLDKLDPGSVIDIAYEATPKQTFDQANVISNDVTVSVGNHSVIDGQPIERFEEIQIPILRNEQITITADQTIYADASGDGFAENSEVLSVRLNLSNPSNYATNVVITESFGANLNSKVSIENVKLVSDLRELVIDQDYIVADNDITLFEFKALENIEVTFDIQTEDIFVNTQTITNDVLITYSTGVSNDTIESSASYIIKANDFIIDSSFALSNKNSNPYLSGGDIAVFETTVTNPNFMELTNVAYSNQNIDHNLVLDSLSTSIYAINDLGEEVLTLTLNEDYLIEEDNIVISSIPSGITLKIVQEFTVEEYIYNNLLIEGEVNLSNELVKMTILKDSIATNANEYQSGLIDVVLDEKVADDGRADPLELITYKANITNNGLTHEQNVFLSIDMKDPNVSLTPLSSIDNVVVYDNIANQTLILDDDYSYEVDYENKIVNILIHDFNAGSSYDVSFDFKMKRTIDNPDYLAALDLSLITTLNYGLGSVNAYEYVTTLENTYPIDPNVPLAEIFANDTDVYVLNAPTSERHLLQLMEVTATDYDNTTLDSELVVVDVDGLDYTNPHVGSYDITFEVTGKSLKTTTQTAVLTLFDETAFNYSHTLSVTDGNDELVTPSETLTYEYSFINEGNYSFENASFVNRFDDNDLQHHMLLESVTLDGVGYNDYEVIPNGIKVPVIGVGQEVVVKYTIKASSYFDASPSVDNFVMLKSGISLVDNLNGYATASLNKDYLNSTSYTIEQRVSDFSGDDMASSLEQLYYDIQVVNDGQMSLIDLVIDFNLSDVNLDPYTDLYVFIDDQVVAIDPVGSQITIPELKVGSTAKLRIYTNVVENISVSNLDESYIDNEISVSTTNIPEVKNDTVSILIDTNSAISFDITTSLTEKVAYNALANPSELLLSQTVFTNTGNVNLDNIAIEDTHLSYDLVQEKATPTVTRNDVVLVEGEDYQIIDNIVLVDTVLPNDVITVAYDITANDSFSSSQFITNDINVSNGHSDIIVVSSELEKDLSMANYEVSMTVSDVNNNLAAPSEKLTYEITLVNDSPINIDDIVLKINNNDRNLNDSTITNVSLIDFETGLDHYFKIIDGEVHIDTLKSGETLVLSYEINVADTIRTGTFNLIKNVNNRIVVNDTFGINKQASASIGIDFEVGNDFNVEVINFNEAGVDREHGGLVAPGERIYYEIVVNNSGGFSQNNITLKLELDDQLIPSSLSHFIVVNQTNDPVVQSLWDYDPITEEIHLQEINPGDEYKILFDVKTKDTFDSSLSIDIDVFANSDLVDSKFAHTYLNTDLSGGRVDISKHFVDSSTGGAFVRPLDTVTYEILVENNGKINLDSAKIYDITSDMSEFNVERVELINSLGEITDVTGDASYYATYNNEIDIYKLPARNNLLFTVTLKANSMLGDFVTNEILLSSPIIPEDITDVEYTQVNPHENLLINLSAATDNTDPRVAKSESVITYDMQLKNEGVTAMNNITVAKGDLVDINVDPRSFSFVSAVSSTRGELVLGTDYTVDSQDETWSIYVSELQANEIIYLKYSYNVLDVITANDVIENTFKVYYEESILKTKSSILLDNHMVLDLAMNAYDYLGEDYAVTGNKITPADYIVYDLTLTNTGDTIVDGIEVHDQTNRLMVESITNVDVTNNQYYELIDNYVLLNQIFPGDEVHIKYQVRLRDNLVEKQLLNTNMATSNLVNSNEAMTTLDVDLGFGADKLDISQTANQTSVVNNQTINYQTTVFNKANVIQENVVISQLINDENLNAASIENIEVYEDGMNVNNLLDENNDVVIPVLYPQSEVIITYDVDTNNTLTSADLITNQAQVISASTIEPILASTEVNIDRSLINDFNVEQRIIKDENANGLVDASELITYQVKVTNTGFQDNGIELLFNQFDPNITARSTTDFENLVISHDSQGLTPVASEDIVIDQGKITINNVVAGNSIYVTYGLRTTNVLVAAPSVVNNVDYSYLVVDALFDGTTTTTMTINPDLNDMSFTYTVNNPENQTYTVKDEVEFDVLITNIGAIEQNDIVIHQDVVDKNLNTLFSKYQIFLTDNTGKTIERELVLNEDYVIENNDVKVNSLASGESILVKTYFQVKPYIVYDDTITNIISVSSAKVARDVKQASAPLNLDNIQNIDIVTTITESVVEDGVLSPGESFDYQAFIANTGNSIEQNVSVIIDMANINVNIDSLNNFVIYDKLSASELELNKDYYVKKNIDGVEFVFIKLNPLDEITISFSGNIYDPVLDETVLSLDESSKVVLESGSEYADTNKSLTIVPHPEGNLKLRVKIDEAVEEDKKLDPGEVVNVTMALTNRSAFSQENYGVYIANEDYNINHDIVHDLVVTSDVRGELVNPDDYTYKSSQKLVNLKTVDPLEQITISYKTEMKDHFSPSKITFIVAKSVSQYNEPLLAASFKPLDLTHENYDITIDYDTANGDKVIDPSEDVYFSSTITNTGSIYGDDVEFHIPVRSLNLVDHVMIESVIDNQTNEALTPEKYTIIGDNIVFNDIYANESVRIEFVQKARNNFAILDTDHVATEIISSLGNTYNSKVALDYSYKEYSTSLSNISVTDNNDNLYELGETISYEIEVKNTGLVDLSNVTITNALDNTFANSSITNLNVVVNDDEEVTIGSNDIVISKIIPDQTIKITFDVVVDEDIIANPYLNYSVVVNSLHTEELALNTLINRGETTVVEPETPIVDPDTDVDSTTDDEDVVVDDTSNVNNTDEKDNTVSEQLTDYQTNEILNTGNDFPVYKVLFIFIIILFFILVRYSLSQNEEEVKN